MVWIQPVPGQYRATQHADYVVMPFMGGLYLVRRNGVAQPGIMGIAPVCQQWCERDNERISNDNPGSHSPVR